MADPRKVEICLDLGQQLVVGRLAVERIDGDLRLVPTAGPSKRRSRTATFGMVTGKDPRQGVGLAGLFLLAGARIVERRNKRLGTAPALPKGETSRALGQPARIIGREFA